MFTAASRFDRQLLILQDSWKKMLRNCRKISDVEEENVIMVGEMLGFSRGLGRGPGWELGTMMEEAGLDREAQGNHSGQRKRGQA